MKSLEPGIERLQCQRPVLNQMGKAGSKDAEATGEHAALALEVDFRVRHLWKHRLPKKMDVRYGTFTVWRAAPGLASTDQSHLVSDQGIV